MLEAYLSALDMGYFEVTEAFRDLPDEHVWKRPAEALLSVGEVAAHVAYWEAARFAGESMEGAFRPNLEKSKISSSFLDHRFSYYPFTIAEPPSEEHLAMTSAQVCAELLRVHNEAITHLKARNPDLDAPARGWPQQKYRHFVEYAIFHISYHTGQMYSARHLLGEETPDN